MIGVTCVVVRLSLNKERNGDRQNLQLCPMGLNRFRDIFWGMMSDAREALSVLTRQIHLAFRFNATNSLPLVH